MIPEQKPVLKNWFSDFEDTILCLLSSIFKRFYIEGHAPVGIASASAALADYGVGVNSVRWIARAQWTGEKN